MHSDLAASAKTMHRRQSSEPSVLPAPALPRVSSPGPRVVAAAAVCSCLAVIITRRRAAHPGHGGAIPACPLALSGPTCLAAITGATRTLVIKGACSLSPKLGEGGVLGYRMLRLMA